MSIGSIGRNEPCPCGSGKKYKKCCINKEENDWQDWFQKDCKQGDKLLQEYEDELQKRLQADNNSLSTQENNCIPVEKTI